jgi:hypothetical protein
MEDGKPHRLQRSFAIFHYPFSLRPALFSGRLVHRRRFVGACLVAAAVILWAPFVSEVRRWIRTEFPGHFVLIVGSAIALIIGGALLATLLRIRHRRALRYGALAAAVLIGVAYSLRYADGRPEIDVVERFHFVEFGLITLLFYRAWRPLDDLSMFVLPALAGLLVGTLEEWFQWFIPVRVGEVRDVFLNGAAITSGLLFSVAVDPPAAITKQLRPGSIRRIAQFASVVIMVFAGFFHSVHLGYAIQDAELGTFRSRYTAGRLADLSAQRTRQWATRPPPLTIPRLSREDQYLTEGIEHVMERNELWGRGDAAGAWHENRILEKYFAPVIDTPSYHSTSGHRWPGEQRANAQVAATLAAEASPRRSAYVSQSNPAPIFTWPIWLYWLSIAAVVISLTAASRLVERRRRLPIAAGTHTAS